MISSIHLDNGITFEINQAQRQK